MLCTLVIVALPLLFFFFFFNDTATTEIYTLSLHDALPICELQSDLLQLLRSQGLGGKLHVQGLGRILPGVEPLAAVRGRSEEHTSELQSPCNLVCRLLLEKKKENTVCYVHIPRRSSRDAYG